MLAAPPPVEELTPTQAWEFLAILIAVAVLMIGLTWAFVWAMLRSARYPAPAMLVTCLSMLTLVALGAAVITGSAALETIAATGFGALAGAVSHQFVAHQARLLEQRQDESPPEAEE